MWPSLKNLALLVLLWPVMSMAEIKLDAVLMLDVSASMMTTDPDDRRLEAINQFLALLDKNDRLALITFDGNARLVSSFQVLDPVAKGRLAALLLDKAQPSGAYTNLHAPVALALEQFKNHRPDAQPLAIMLTDGQMDMGDTEHNQRLSADLEGPLVAAARVAQVRLYSLSFSPFSDFKRLSAVTQLTGGFSRVANQASDLSRVFLDLFAAIKDKKSLPVQGGRFRVDEWVRELSVVAKGGQGLLSPSGTHYANEVGQGGGVIKVSNPEPGDWTINGNDGDNRVFVSREPAYESRSSEPRVQTSGEQEGAAVEDDDSPWRVSFDESSAAKGDLIELLLGNVIVLAVLGLGFGIALIWRKRNKHGSGGETSP